MTGAPFNRGDIVECVEAIRVSRIGGPANLKKGGVYTVSHMGGEHPSIRGPAWRTYLVGIRVNARGYCHYRFRLLHRPSTSNFVEDLKKLPTDQLVKETA